MLFTRVDTVIGISEGGSYLSELPKYSEDLLLQEVVRSKLGEEEEEKEREEVELQLWLLLWLWMAVVVLLLVVESRSWCRRLLARVRVC